MSTPKAASSLHQPDTLFDYFLQAIHDAAALHGHKLSPDTSLYLAQLLSDRARADQPRPEAHTLVDLHAAAQDVSPADQTACYRELGDRALYTLGFFHERLDRSLVGPTYYRQMGAAAYERVDALLKRWFADPFGPVFRELSSRFNAAADILRWVRQEHAQRADPVTELYERWLATGCSDTAARLRRHGLILPQRPGHA